MRTKMTLEAISFQKSNFFEDLTQAVHELRDDLSLVTMRLSEFFNSGKVNNLGDIIKKYTNLSATFVDGEETGFATNILTVDANHIFLDQDLIKFIMEYNSSADPYESINGLFNKLKKSTLAGGVDLKTARVYGTYTELPVVIYMPRNILMDKNFLSDGEIAAILLHEVGHNFTMLELVGRTVTTNQVLVGLSKYLDRSVGDEDRVAVFSKAASELKMDDTLTQELKKCKTPQQLSVVLLDADIVKSKSELGASLYDVNSCEWLADQFATRFGAGKELVTGLDKYLTMYWHDTRHMFYSQLMGVIFTILVIFLAMLNPGQLVTLSIILFFVVFGPHKEDEIYDKPQARFERIRRDMVERLKDTRLSTAQKKQCLATIQGMDTVIKSERFEDSLLWAEKVAYYLRPGYRAAHKYEMMQKDLEKIANNDLFVKSVELKTA